MSKNQRLLVAVFLTAVSAAMLAANINASKTEALPNDSLAIGQFCADGKMQLRAAKDTALVALVTYVNGTRKKGLTTGVGIKIKPSGSKNFVTTPWRANSDCWTVIPIKHGKKPQLCAVIRVPGFQATGPSGACPEPTPVPNDKANRLQYVFIMQTKPVPVQPAGPPGTLAIDLKQVDAGRVTWEAWQTVADGSAINSCHLWISGRGDSGTIEGGKNFDDGRGIVQRGSFGGLPVGTTFAVECKAVDDTVNSASLVIKP